MKLNFYSTISLFVFLCFTVLTAKTQTAFEEDSLFNYIVYNPQTQLKQTTFKDTVLKDFYELENPRNEWIAFKEYYHDGSIREKGVFFNGYYYGVWTQYDSLGLIVSQIDYEQNNRLIGENQRFIQDFQIVQAKGDSIIKCYFDSASLQYIRFNSSQSSWRSMNKYGDWFDDSYEQPKKFRLRYSIIYNDTIWFTPIEINFKVNEGIQISEISGFSTDSLNSFIIDFNTAFDIAVSKGYGKLDDTVFKSSELLTLSFYEGNYYWKISRIEKDIFKKYENSESMHVTADGKTLYINCKTGETKELDFDGVQIFCR